MPLTKSGITQPIESQLTAAFQQAQSELIGFVRTNATPGALCSCVPAPPATTCTCSSSSQANNLPPDTCGPSPCTLPIPSAADPCSNATPPTKISYRILYDINRPSCGGPAPMTNTAVSTLLDVNAPITAGSCSTSLSTGGGGAVFTSICNGATNSPNPLSKSFLGGIQ